MLADEYKYLDSRDRIRYINIQTHYILMRRCRDNEKKYLVGKAIGEPNAEARLYLASLTNKCNWMEVLAIGKDVDVGQKVVLEVSDFALVPEYFNEQIFWRGVLEDENLYIYKDAAVLAFCKGNEK